MPNILKGFMRPKVEDYAFPDSAELPVEPDPVLRAEPEPEEETVPERPHDYHDPRTPVDYARLQAEVILAEARKQADALLESTRQQAQASWEKAREEGRVEGYRAGYAEGMAGAQSEVRADQELQAAQLEAKVGRFLEDAARAREDLIAETTDELKELALTVAEKVVRVSLRSSGEVVGRMIQGAIEKLKRREWVHIYIAGCDAKSMAKLPPALAASLNAVSDHVKIVPMADDETGTCIIEMPDEIIDASASTQLSNIRQLMSDMSPRDMSL